MGLKKKTFLLKLGLVPILIYFSYLLIGFFLYNPAIKSYFFQDDWFTFKISMISSLKDFLEFFIPRLDVIYYRPLGMQVYFFIMRNIFGFNFFYYRWTALLLHSFNSFLIYYLLSKMNIRKTISFFVGILYVTSITSFIPLFWSSTFPFILGVTFFLLTLIFYFKSDTLKNYYFSLFLYLLGLLTFEITVICPIILLLWEIMINKNKQYLKTVKYFILTGIYFCLRFMVYRIPIEGTYQPSLKIFSTLRTYILWSLNWPEEMSKQFIKIFALNPQFYNSFAKDVNFWFIGTIILIILVIIIPPIISFFIFKSKIKLLTRISLFGLIWFLICLIPLFLFSEHTYSYYLPVGLVGLLIFFATQFNKISEYLNRYKIIQLIYFLSVVTIWVGMSKTTFNFNLLTFWIPKSACQSHEVINKASLLNHAIFESDQPVIYITDSRFSQALNDQDALQVIFNNPKIRTIYQNNKEILSDKEVIVEVSDDNCTGLIKKY